MKLQNKLDNFVSHSVHYVMLACRSTEDVRLFTSADQNTSLAAIDACQKLGQEVIIPGSTAKSFLMIDTRRFSQFTIENFNIETLIAGFNVPGSNSPHSAAVNMGFTVLDSVGISFANFLQYLMDQKLQVSYDGMTLLVRILFVGHKPSKAGTPGETEVVQSITIPAIFNAIQVDLSDTKGVYNCTAFPLLGMPSTSRYNAKWTSIGDVTTYFSGKGSNTLGAMVRSFEESLNNKSIARYRQMNGLAQQPGENDKTVGLYGRPVQYMITIPSSWDSFLFSGPVQGGAQEIDFRALLKTESEKKTQAAQQKTTARGEDSYVGVEPDWTITEVLDKMFAQTVEVSKLANFARGASQTESIKFYKHIVSVTSNDEAFMVHVDVVEFEVPNVHLGSSAIGTDDSSLYETIPATGTQAARKVPKNYLEYDYFFSGKNIDVLSLDLKMENLNWMLMQGVKLGAGELFSVADKGQNQPDGNGVQVDTKMVQGIRQKDPFLLPRQTPGQRSNFTNLSAGAQGSSELTAQEINQQYTRNLAAFYNAGPVTAKLELRGNPDLISGVVLQKVPEHRNSVTIGPSGASSVNQDAKAAHRAEFEETLAQSSFSNLGGGRFQAQAQSKNTSFLTSPVFVKVNIYGPNVDFSTNELIPGQNFSQKLFDENYYFISKVTSKIEHAKFTHEVDLLSYSVYGFKMNTAQGQQANPAIREIQ